MFILPQKAGALTVTDWDIAYDNAGHAPESRKLAESWSQNAADYRASGVRMDDAISYGSAEREQFDLIWPDGDPKGLAVYVHGGYWHMRHRSDWTDLAEGARAKGWAVAIPGYSLAPDVRITQITRQVGAAINAAANLVNGPIRLAGHSAGGHLVSRMVCADTPLTLDCQARLEHVLSISGLHDLRPLMQTRMNEILQLDAEEAARESAALLEPNGQPVITCWVGGGELPEFIRQAQLLPLIWRGFDVHSDCVIDGQHDHFTVIGDLKDPGSAITRALVG